MATLSFNGNKVITTGGGGMIITNDLTLAQIARYWIYHIKNMQRKWCMLTIIPINFTRESCHTRVRCRNGMFRIRVLLITLFLYKDLLPVPEELMDWM